MSECIIFKPSYVGTAFAISGSDWLGLQQAITCLADLVFSFRHIKMPPVTHLIGDGMMWGSTKEDRKITQHLWFMC